jgi:Spy/CpxP family protein refolding chaperone
MKTRWIVPLLLAAAALSFTADRHAGTAAPAELNPAADLQKVARTLNLTPEQTRQVDALTSEFCRQAQTACDEHCAARCQLARSLFVQQADAAASRALVDRMCAAYAEREHATLEHLLKLRDVLTPAQRSELNRQMALCLCDHCASSTGACCSGESHHEGMKP